MVEGIFAHILQCRIAMNVAGGLFFFFFNPQFDSYISELVLHMGKGVWLIITLFLPQLPGSLSRVSGEAEKGRLQEGCYSRRADELHCF